MKKISKEIRTNRQLFLHSLRTGGYKKGTIRSDEKGIPIIETKEDNDGCCACAVMISLFPKEGKPNFLFARQQLGIKGSDCRYIQQDLNDTALTFPEIADRILIDVFKGIV